MKLMFTSRWLFSTALAASATLMLGAIKVPFSKMELYKSSMRFATSGVEPDVILRIFVSVFTLSPGLMRSGE